MSGTSQVDVVVGALLQLAEHSHRDPEHAAAASAWLADLAGKPSVEQENLTESRQRDSIAAWFTWMDSLPANLTEARQHPGYHRGPWLLSDVLGSHNLMECQRNAPAKAKTAKPVKGDPAQVYHAITAFRQMAKIKGRVGQSDLEVIATAISSLAPEQIRELKSDMNLITPGDKADLARKLAERALERSKQ